jgi:hypothetical protein
MMLSLMSHLCSGNHVLVGRCHLGRTGAYGSFDGVV